MKRCILALLVISLSSCNRTERRLEKTVTPVRVETVATFTPRTGERYSASIVPYRQVSLAFRVGGFVDFLHQVPGPDGRPRNLEPGDVVTAGTLLARLRQQDYQIQVDQAQSQLDAARESEQAAKAQLAQAQAGAVKAEADFGRAQSLRVTQSLTRPDFDAAQAQQDSSRAQVEAARAQLDSASARIRSAEASLASAKLAAADTSLSAPFAAVVVQRNLEIGTLAGPSAAAFSLADISSVKAAFGVPDAVAVALKPGMAVSIAIEALPGREFRGAVTAISAVGDASTRLFQVELALPNTPQLLRPGLIASLSLGPAATAAAAPVPVVPLSAVIRDRQGGSSFAVMVVEGNVARARPVTLGPTYGDRLAITSGINPGEKVISSGATQVTDGETVEVMP